MLRDTHTKCRDARFELTPYKSSQPRLPVKWAPMNAVIVRLPVVAAEVDGSDVTATARLTTAPADRTEASRDQ